MLQLEIRPLRKLGQTDRPTNRPTNRRKEEIRERKREREREKEKRPKGEKMWKAEEGDASEWKND